MNHQSSRGGHRKFGKTIAKRQLDVPDYAASFVNYKGLKKVGKPPAAHLDFARAARS
jgi:hypothetical protein